MTVCKGEEDIKNQLTDCLQEHGRLQTEDKVHTHMHAHTHVIVTHTHSHVHICTHTHVHTCTHTYTHTYLQHHRHRVQSRDRRIHTLADQLKLEDVGSTSLSPGEVRDFLTRVASVRKAKEESAKQEKVNSVM